MKIQMRMIKIIACLLIIFCLSGCWSAREINDLEIVIGIGVDQGKGADNVSLTAQIVKPEEMRNPSTEQGSDGNQAYWNAHSSGRSIFDAVRDITHQTGNRLFVSHSQVLIFSKGIAETGIEKYMDFFLRTHEMRPSTMIFVSEDTAAEVLEKKPEKEKLPAINLSKLITASKFTSEAEGINLMEFSSRMMSKTASPLAPLVKLSETEGTDNYNVVGMAVFKQFNMVGTLDGDETEGYLWVENKVKSEIIHVSTPKGNGIASLEVNKAKSKATPELKDGKILIHIKIREESSLTEQSSPESLVTVESLETMQQEQVKAIQQSIIQAFEKSKELDCDIFGFGELIHKKYPSEWKRMEKDWDKLYHTIELVYDIDTKIRKTELITKPIFSREE